VRDELALAPALAHEHVLKLLAAERCRTGCR
jgi:hypothetical protein